MLISGSSPLNIRALHTSQKKCGINQWRALISPLTAALYLFLSESADIMLDKGLKCKSKYQIYKCKKSAFLSAHSQPRWVNTTDTSCQPARTRVTRDKADDAGEIKWKMENKKQFQKGWFERVQHSHWSRKEADTPLCHPEQHWEQDFICILF